MNEAYTYFGIIYNKDNFDLNVFCSKLSLKDSDVVLADFSKKIDSNKGKIKIGYCNRYNHDLNVMVRETLNGLVGKESLLVELKESYDLEFYLERVVYIDKKDDSVKPLLSLDNDIVEFLYNTEAIDDLDYYIV